MSEEVKPSVEKTPEQIQHESNKVVREALAFAHWRLQTVPYIHEDRKNFEVSINVLEALCHDLQKKIEAVEPPAPVEPEVKKPYIIEVPPLAPESPDVEPA